METDKEMVEILKQDFSTLNEATRKSIIEMTKFLVLTQNTIVPEILHKDQNITVEKNEKEGVGK
jgi:hypothetical protein